MHGILIKIFGIDVERIIKNAIWKKTEKEKASGSNAGERRAAKNIVRASQR